MKKESETGRDAASWAALVTIVVGDVPPLVPVVGVIATDALASETVSANGPNTATFRIFRTGPTNLEGAMTMLMRFDPLREFDRVFDQAWSQTRQASVPMDAYRHEDMIVINLDLPGVDAGSIDLTVERNMLTITAERHWQPVEGDQVLAAERRQGSFSRQVFLSDGLDAEQIHATYENGEGALVVDTGFWIFGKKRMLPAGVVQGVDEDSRKVFVSCSKDAIKQAPDYDEQRRNDAAYRRDVGYHYEGDPIGPQPGPDLPPG